MKSETHQLALDYAARGWAVFPLHTVDDKLRCTCGKNPCKDAGKHPRVDRGVKEATKDIAKIDAWFGPKGSPSNIGIATGAVSALTILDIDIADGKGGAESWAEAIGDHGEPDTLMARTGSGGMHVVFKYNSALKTASNVLGKGVDCRNDGGYIVAPPSRHRSGGRYEWINAGAALADLPAHLAKRKDGRGRPKKDDVFRKKYSIEQIEKMLGAIPSDDRDLWRHVGIILGREYNRSDDAWKLYTAWSAKTGGKKGRNHDEIMHEAFYDLSQTTAEKVLSMGTIVKLAMEHGWAPQKGEVPIEHFVFFGAGNSYIYRPTVSMWVAAAVDAMVSPQNVGGNIVKPSDWIKEHASVTSMTCDPKYDEDIIKGHDCRDGEMAAIVGAATFNSYRKPTIELGDARLAGPFVDHCRKVFNKTGDADQFLDYMAHRVQRPWEKPRFALLIGGDPGVGKDTAVEFCCPAIGAWNVANIEPSAFDSSFNEYAASTLIRISEAANLHEMTKWAFNERTKVLIAGSPDYVSINPKYGQKFSVRMYCGVIITTNHLTSGIYIPEGDRRYDVIESATMMEMKLVDEVLRKAYFGELWDWFLEGGAEHVAAFLTERNIKEFSANNGQRKTNAHKSVVAEGRVGDQWLMDIIDEMGSPMGIRADVIRMKAIAAGEREMDIRRKLSVTIGRVGYTMFRCPTTADGRWKISDQNITIYVKNGTQSNYDPLSDSALQGSNKF